MLRRQWSAKYLCLLGRLGRKRRQINQIAAPARDFPAEKSLPMPLQKMIVFSSHSPIHEGWTSRTLNQSTPRSFTNYWRLSYPAAGDVQNPMVSSRLHAFAWVHPFCFVKTSPTGHTRCCYSER